MNIKKYGNLPRGIYTVIPVSLWDSEENEIDLKDQRILITVKKDIFDYDRDDRFAAIQKEITVEKGNSFYITFTAEDMDIAPGTYYMDIVIGQWRAAQLELMIEGGPSNKQVLSDPTGSLVSAAPPLRIIAKAEKPIVLITNFNPLFADLEQKIMDKANKILRMPFYPIEKRKILLNEEENNYLYECWYDKLDYSEYGNRDSINIPIGACSSARNGHFVGRNYDWFYNNAASFIIHTPKIGTKYASIGIAGLTSLTKDKAEQKELDYDFSRLPFFLLDGINDEGLVANINVVPKYDSPKDTIPNIEEREKINGLCIVRYILDNFSTAKAAVEYIRDYVSVFFPNALLSKGYILHVMVCDNQNTYIIEFDNDKNYIFNMTHTNPFMTNFSVKDVIFNRTGSVYTPETQTENFDAVKTNHINPLGSGLERYNVLSKNLGAATTKEAMRRLMDSISYSRAYEVSPNPSSPFWYTECVGGDLFVNSPLQKFRPVVDIMNELYLNRSRETAQTWHTVHSTIYDLVNKKLYVKIQEQPNEFEVLL